MPYYSILDIEDLSKTFKVKAGDVNAVKNVDFRARKGEVSVIVGPSGSGKTTLLYLIGSLEKPDTGEINVFGEDICRSDTDLIKYRREHVGFVFQFFNLVPALTVLENAILPMDISGKSKPDEKARAAELLERMGIDRRLQKSKPNRISGVLRRLYIF